MKLYTFEELLDNCLDVIPSDIDKSEGSLIYTAIAPICAELAKYYIEVKNSYDLSFVQTSFHEYLDTITNQFGVYRKTSTPSIRLSHFFDKDDVPCDIPLHSKFSIDTLLFEATKQVENGIYQLTCLSNGVIGNKPFGQLSPCQYIPNLFRATLDDTLVLGSEEESDEDLKQRFKLKMTSPAFGGNRSDYQQLFLSLEEVCAVRITPCFDGGGTVKAVILYRNFQIPTDDFIQAIKEQVDPTKESGKGIGLAPIGHQVTVFAPTSTVVDFTTELSLKNGWTSDAMLPYIEKIIDEYLLEIAKQFSFESTLVVRISQLESRILALDGVLDIQNTTLNNATNNIVLKEDSIPLRGVVVC